MVPIIYIGVANSEVILTLAAAGIAATSAAIGYGTSEAVNYFDNKSAEEVRLETYRNLRKQGYVIDRNGKVLKIEK